MTNFPTITPRFIGWCAFAAIGGVCSFVLPPYLVDGGITQPAYGWPLIPWFAIAVANRQISFSMGSFFLLGLTLGITHPRRWYLLAGVAMASPILLHCINILHDWTRDSTSHNLFPLEFLFYGFICLPALVGAILGLFSRRLWRRKNAA